MSEFRLTDEQHHMFDRIRKEYQEKYGIYTITGVVRMLIMEKNASIMRNLLNKE